MQLIMHWHILERREIVTEVKRHTLDFFKEIRTPNQPGVLAHVFGPSTWGEAGGSLSSRPAWSTARATQKDPV